MMYYYDMYNHYWTAEDMYKKICVQDDENLEKLKSRKKNKDFLIVRNNRKPSYGKYFYYDIEDVKLLLTDKVFLAYESTHSKSMLIVNILDIKNPEILKNVSEDLRYVIEYVDKSMDGIGLPPCTRKEIAKSHYDSLSDEGKLYYQIEGKYSDLY